MSTLPCVLTENTLKINNGIFILPFARKGSAFTRRQHDIRQHDFTRQDQEIEQREMVGERLMV